jgi:starch-binding outer membrane protein, SusD/RagB family
MKKKLYSKMAVVLMVLVALTSCQDLLDTPDIKTNPNAPTDATLDVLISGTLVGLSTVSEDTDARLSMMWSGQLAGLSRQHAGFETYIVAGSTFDNSWAILYSAAGNARLIQAKSTPTNNRITLGIGQVVEALLISKATSLYGDVPYSQAMDIVAYPNPVYDKQADIYAALITLLENAYSNLKSNVGKVDGSKEFIFGGDAAKWAAAAKTLQARLYLHLGDYAKAIASAKLGIANGGDALIPHGSSQQIDLNLNFDFFDISRPGDTGFDAPAFLPGFMVAHANSKTDETALYNHYFINDYYAAKSLDPNTQDGMFTGDTPHPLLTYYETQFILAESYARQNDIPNALTALNNVRAGLRIGYINGKTIIKDYRDLGIKYDDYVSADFNPGGLANPVSSGRDQQKGLIYEVLSQKYIVSLAQYDAFMDVRRSAKALPLVQLPIPIVSGTKSPQRFIYPQNETNTNPNTPSPTPDQFTKIPILN